MGIPFGARADARAAIGSVVVDLTPGPIKEWAIQTLGSLDKLFLAVVVLVAIATIAAIAGTLETQRRPLGSAAIAAAGVLGCIAVLSRQGATALDTIPTVAGAASAWARRSFPDGVSGIAPGVSTTTLRGSTATSLTTAHCRNCRSHVGDGGGWG